MTVRSLQNRAAAHIFWSQCADRSAATAPAREGFDARFAREVDPDGVLAPAERARRVASARKAYFARLAAASVAARQRKVS